MEDLPDDKPKDQFSIKKIHLMLKKALAQNYYQRHMI
jgi:hypothetical protein